MPSKKGSSSKGSQNGDEAEEIFDSSKESFLASLSIIVFGIGVKVKECKLCGAKSTDATQLVVPEGAPEGSQYWPWLHYSAHADHAGCKSPCGRICSICMNVYNLAGSPLKCL